MSRKGAIYRGRIIHCGLYPEWVGRLGYFTNPNKIGNVNFYTDEGTHPYVVVLDKDNVEEIGGE